MRHHPSQIIQRMCNVCGGNGLVPSSRNERYMRKCPQCGGFFPWVSWKLFLTSTAAPGNGGERSRLDFCLELFLFFCAMPLVPLLLLLRTAAVSQGPRGEDFLRAAVEGGCAAEGGTLNPPLKQARGAHRVLEARLQGGVFYCGSHGEEGGDSQVGGLQGDFG